MSETLQPALAYTGVTRRFGETVAVDDVTVEVRPDEILVLVGPSGCGKSTMLRLAAGLLGVHDGTIRLAGRLVDDGRISLPPERRHIGLVFQEHALFPHLTVARNIAFGLRGAGRDATRARVGAVLELVGLTELRDRYPHELSGGERQRVALARALAPEPTLLLLDEPFASLDPNLRATIREDVIAILRAASTPAVFVTHDQGEALAVGDRIAVMRAGGLEQVGTPWAVFHRPANRFVASFMGEASFLDIAGGAGVPTCELGPVAVDHLDDRSAAVAMVRPDDLTVTVDAAADGEVVAGEFRGSAWSYRIALSSGAVVRATISHNVELKPGDRVSIGLAEGHRPVAVVDKPVTG